MEVILRRGSQRCAAQYGVSMVDWLCGDDAPLQRGPHYEALSVVVDVDEAAGQVVLTPAPAGEPGAVQLGRAAPTADAESRRLFGSSVDCPVAELGRRGVALPPRHPAPRVGSVTLPRIARPDGTHDTLLTKRAPHMRTFPRAWVFPGGAVDPNESPATAALREVHEETGLRLLPDTLRLAGLWESVYPTTAEGCQAAGQVGGHFLVMYYTGVVEGESAAEAGALPAGLALQESEVCDAVAVPDAVWGEVCRGGAEGAGVLPGLHGSVPLSSLHGIYPNTACAETAEGIAQGHLFMLDSLLSIGESCGYRGCSRM